MWHQLSPSVHLGVGVGGGAKKGRASTLHSDNINPLTPNDPYSGSTAPLTSKVAFYIFIQQIQVLNILNIVYTLRFFLFKLQFVS